MKQVVSIFLSFILCNCLYAAVQIAGIQLDILQDYSVSQYDGDSDKYTLLQKGTDTAQKVSVVFFRKNGKAEPDYTPKASEVPLIEAYIGGNTSIRPFAWPFNYRRVFLPNIKQYGIECLTLCEFEIGNIQFTRTIVFTDAVYCYVIEVRLPQLEKILPQKMPDYFKRLYDSRDAFEWNSDKLEELLDTFKKHEPLPGYFKILTAETDAVIKTIKKL